MDRLTKKPLQIYLDSKQDEVLRDLAHKRGTSVGHLIRESLARYIAEEVPVEEDPAMGIIGLGASERGDLSVSHDKYLAKMEQESNR